MSKKTDNANQHIKTLGVTALGTLSVFGTASGQGEFCDSGLVGLIANFIELLLAVGPLIAVGGIALSIILWSQYTQGEKKAKWRSRGIASGAGFALLISFDAIVSLLITISGNEAAAACLDSGGLGDLI